MTPQALALLHAQAFTSPRPWTETEFADVLGGPGAFLLTEGEGFAVGRAIAGEAELLTLAVPQAARRQGVGRRLLARFEAKAAERGAATAYLEVAADNTAALALYAKAGWYEAGRRAGYYARQGAPSVDALVLTKALGPA